MYSSKLLHGFVKKYKWISLSCYMDLSKLLHEFGLLKYLSKKKKIVVEEKARIAIKNDATTPNSMQVCNKVKRNPTFRSDLVIDSTFELIMTERDINKFPSCSFSNRPATTENLLPQIKSTHLLFTSSH